MYVVGMQRFKEKSGKDKGNNYWRNGGRIEVVNHFSYLGDTIDCDAGVERSVRCREATAWKNWKEIASLLVNINISLKYFLGMR